SRPARMPCIEGSGRRGSVPATCRWGTATTARTSTSRCFVGGGWAGAFRRPPFGAADSPRGRRLAWRGPRLASPNRAAPPGAGGSYEEVGGAMEVRVGRVHVDRRGFRTRVLDLVATLLDAEVYTKKDLASLYRRRWDAELHLRSIKVVLELDVLRCKTPELV